MKDNEFEKIEKLLNEQKIQKVPPHLLSRFSEEVLERIENKPGWFPRFEFRLFPVLVPAAVGIILVSVFLLPDLKGPQTAQAPAPVAVASRPAQPAVPLTFEQQMRLLDEMDDESAFEVATAQVDSSLTVEDEMRLLEELGANHVTDDSLTDEEVILYEIETTTSRG